MNKQLPIEIKSCELTRNSASFAPGLPWAEWLDAGQQLCKVAGATLWWIGDWINYGEKAYGEKYKLALEMTDYEIGTLQNAAWVSKQVESSRRREGLRFGHHQEVAPMDEDKQVQWLNEAASNQWTVSQLRQAIRKHQAVYIDDEPNPGLFRWATAAQEVERHLKAMSRDNPPEKWPQEQKESIKKLLEPIVSVYDRIKEAA